MYFPVLALVWLHPKREQKLRGVSCVASQRTRVYVCTDNHQAIQDAEAPSVATLAAALQESARYVAIQIPWPKRSRAQLPPALHGTLLRGVHPLELQG